MKKLIALILLALSVPGNAFGRSRHLTQAGKVVVKKHKQRAPKRTVIKTGKRNRHDVHHVNSKELVDHHDMNDHRSAPKKIKKSRKKPSYKKDSAKKRMKKRSHKKRMPKKHVSKKRAKKPRSKKIKHNSMRKEAQRAEATQHVSLDRSEAHEHYRKADEARRKATQAREHASRIAKEGKALHRKAMKVPGAKEEAHRRSREMLKEERRLRSAKNEAVHDADELRRDIEHTLGYAVKDTESLLDKAEDYIEETHQHEKAGRAAEHNMHKNCKKAGKVCRGVKRAKPVKAQRVKKAPKVKRRKVKVKKVKHHKEPSRPAGRRAFVQKKKSRPVKHGNEHKAKRPKVKRPKKVKVKKPRRVKKMKAPRVKKVKVKKARRVKAPKKKKHKKAKSRKHTARRSKSKRSKKLYNSSLVMEHESKEL